ncbi:hypothetical protein [Streptomyces sp. NPDC088141]|uniref:hypothetical protein n=1 Tax=unclassified Streptomyces TaxID=2593676 RepID=UPI0034482F98
MSTRPHHPVMVHFGEAPKLPERFDLVHLGLGLGLYAVAHLVETGEAVGPYMVCRQHARLLIPVPTGTADTLWDSTRDEYSRHTTVMTIKCGQSYSKHCASYIWVEQLGPGPRAKATDSGALHSAINTQRSRLARGAGKLPDPSVREVCHA